ncbi:MAG TPA: hypothetical protein VLS89_17010, partial [Candidatus Nanopelagicales bacterium]|nr:hypothetical protein [Candidatus Nanopelagicales bacterium]
SVSNTRELGTGGSFTSDIEVRSGEYGRIDVFEICGVYEGHLFVSLESCPRDSDGYTTHTVNNKTTRTRYRMFVFPMRAVVVKAPSTGSPFLRVPRTWPQGTTAP